MRLTNSLNKGKTAANGNLRARHVPLMPAIIPGMPRRKRRTKKQPEPAPIAKIKKRQRRRKPVAEPLPVLAEPKTPMQRTFENQRQELDRLNAELQKKVTG